jgi:hypothetical protein
VCQYPGRGIFPKKPSKSKCDNETCWAYFMATESLTCRVPYLVHFHECLCRGSACCLRYPFLGTFCIPNPFSCLLIFIYYLQVPFAGFKHYSFIFLAGIKSCIDVHSVHQDKGRLPLEGVELKLALGFYSWPFIIPFFLSFTTFFLYFYSSCINLDILALLLIGK